MHLTIYKCNYFVELTSNNLQNMNFLLIFSIQIGKPVVQRTPGTLVQGTVWTQLNMILGLLLSLAESMSLGQVFARAENHAPKTKKWGEADSSDFLGLF